jgi:YD repeat-containing protein
MLLTTQLTYTYDDLGRLETVTYDDGSVVEYDYDETGNRTAVTTVLN